MSAEPLSPSLSWTVAWAHGEFTLQALGGMLAPVRFDLGAGHSLSPMQIAPWGEENDPALPGILRRLRGEWPCVPFGRTSVPEGVPAGYAVRAADDCWDHGFASHHEWKLVERGAAHLHVAIDYPADSPVRRLERIVTADPRRPTLSVELRIHARAPARIPVALHPTFAVPPSGLVLQPPRNTGLFSYPLPAESGVSRLRPEARSDAINALATADGTLDASRLPLTGATEELLQIKDCAGAFVLRYPGQRAELALQWDTALLPDVMLWISNGGRAYAPWSGRHFALGVEPVNGFFDLGRVLVPPTDHPLAGRRGVSVGPDAPVCITYTMSAQTADC